MILMENGKYVVSDTETKDIISTHVFSNEYERKKALDLAKESNKNWKDGKANEKID